MAEEQASHRAISVKRPFHDRYEGGRFLASELMHYSDRSDVVVLALPRGGVPVGFEVAQALHAPLDVLVVRKLGVPGFEELAMGALASGGRKVLERDRIRALGIPERLVDEAVQRESLALARLEKLYRADRRPADVEGRTVILIDDGLATGSSMRAAVSALKARGRPERIIVAAPVASEQAIDDIAAEVDEIVCGTPPGGLDAIGSWYESFLPVSDYETSALLKRADRWTRKGPPVEEPMTETIEIPRATWREYLSSFSQQHEGWLVNVEIQGVGEEGPELMIHQLPLEEIRVEGDDISISVTREMVGRITQWIRSPERILVERAEDGTDHGLRIEFASGGLAHMHFRAAVRLDAIDGAA